MMSKKFQAAAVAAVAAMVLAGCSSGPSGTGDEKDFAPKGDVEMIVPFSAGGGSDISGRSIASGLEAATGLNVNVQNREGGSGAVGYSYLLSQKGKDTVLLAAETTLVALPIQQSDVGFDYTSFTPIMKLGDDFTLLVVPADSKFDSCSAIIDAAKSDRVVAAVSGALSLDQVVFTLVEQATGVTFDRVPFESGSEVLAGLLGGVVDIASLNPGEVIGQLQGGSLKALCAFSEERYDYPDLKDVPTATEQGIDVAFAQFRGFIAAGDISQEAKDYWISAAKEFEKSDAYSKYLKDNMMQANALYGDDFSAYLKQSSENLKKVFAK